MAKEFGHEAVQVPHCMQAFTMFLISLSDRIVLSGSKASFTGVWLTFLPPLYDLFPRAEPTPTGGPLLPPVQPVQHGKLT